MEKVASQALFVKHSRKLCKTFGDKSGQAWEKTPLKVMGFREKFVTLQPESTSLRERNILL